MTIIKNEATPNVILWRVPYEDFNEGSKLIVAENEEALFYKNGVVEAVFTGGEYSLSTNNYAFLSRVRNLISGGVSAYNCRIIYINKTHKLDNRWGTDGPIQVRDNLYGIQVNLVSRGSYSIQIEDAKKFYMKFAGATASLMKAEDICDFMRSPINQEIKTTLSQIISDRQEEIIGITTKMKSIAESMHDPLSYVFSEYGVRLVNFYIEAIEIIEDDEYLILKEARAQKAARIVLAQGAKAEVGVLGSDYGRVKTADIMMASATNPSTGVMGEGLGLGAGMAMGGIMASSAGNVLTPLNAPSNESSSQSAPTNDSNDRFGNHDQMVTAPCGHKVPQGSRFCPQCGEAVSLACPSCGHELTPDSKFCNNCGASLK